MLARRFHRGKETFKGKLPIMCLIVMKLVILLLDVQRRRTIEVETNIEVKEMKTKKITKIKEIGLAKFFKRKPKMDLMTMMVKWCMLQ